MNKSMYKLLTIGLIALFVGAVVTSGRSTITPAGQEWRGTTIIVPDEYPTIQAAIDAAIDGDTVLVRSGTYTGDGNRDIDFLGKKIIVKSEFGAAHTLIDCDGHGSVPHRGFRFQNQETTDSVLDGFAITDGRALYDSWTRLGGGIYCSDHSSPTIINCSFADNTANYGGGGIALEGHCNPIIKNCFFYDNHAGSIGGGLFIYDSSHPFVENCNFTLNTVVGIGVVGAGIGCTWYSCPEISNCDIYLSRGAEGIYLNDGSSAKITGCTIKWNGFSGIYSEGSNPLVYHNNFIENFPNAYATSGVWDHDQTQSGNYWSDFDEPSEGAWDNDTNDIVDDPYSIPGGLCIDRYPFIEQDGWKQGEVDPEQSFVTTSSGGLTTCPAGDGPPFRYATVTVYNQYWEPMEGLPAAEVDFSVYIPFGTKFVSPFCCTFTPVDPTTDAYGDIRFEVTGGTTIIGDIIIRAIVDEIQLNDSDTLPCTSFDHNVNGVVDLPDLAMFADYGWGNQNLEYDYNWDGVVNLVDFAMFAQHWGHSHS